MLIEACIDTITDAVAAEHAGADRLELCANLDVGGTTPSAGLIRATVAKVAIPVFVLVRPRAGDFVYSAHDVDVMLRDIEAIKLAGAHGIVSGALHPNGAIDEDGLEALLEVSSPLPFTFHRAFDFTRDLDESLDTLVALGAARILTSGGAPRAAEGAAVLRRLIARAQGRLTIVAGGSVRAHNINAVTTSGASEVHLGPRTSASTAMKYRSPNARLTKLGTDDYAWTCLDVQELQHVISRVRGAHA